MTQGNVILQFGSMHKALYKERPGAYAIITDDQGRLLVVDVTGVKSSSYFLPGGALEPDESPETALRREVMEETGLEITSAKIVGCANQYVFTGEEYINKIGTFYKVEVKNTQTKQHETNHRPVWVTVDEFARRAAHEAHVWAVKNFLCL